MTSLLADIQVRVPLSRRPFIEPQVRRLPATLLIRMGNERRPRCEASAARVPSNRPNRKRVAGAPARRRSHRDQSSRRRTR
eukprot:943365-Prymnesium_polylepis.1